MTDSTRMVTGGVDTHKDIHVAAAVEELGRTLGTESFPTTTAGYRRLLGSLRSSGRSSWSGSRAPARGVPDSPASSPRKMCA